MNIIVTGITSGLGEALVNQFQKDTNVTVIGIYKNQQKLNLLKKKIFYSNVIFQIKKV
jgi:NADP-dependent 3-hydroxy acid dehydrogenase YdfG